MAPALPQPRTTGGPGGPYRSAWVSVPALTIVPALMRTHSSVISPRGGRGRVEDLAEQGRAMARQRVSRARLAPRGSPPGPRGGARILATRLTPGGARGGGAAVRRALPAARL